MIHQAMIYQVHPLPPTSNGHPRGQPILYPSSYHVGVLSLNLQSINRMLVLDEHLYDVLIETGGDLTTSAVRRNLINLCLGCI
jgi:hypothetical protein